MVEIHDINGTCNFGCFNSFKASICTLNGLIASGELSGTTPSVLVSSYRGNELQREYTVTLSNGKWRTPKGKRTKSAASQPQKGKVRSVHSRITGNSHIRCMKEGFPDWLNKTYQPL